MTYPCLTKNGAQGLLHHAVAKLKARGARVTTTEQGMIIIEVLKLEHEEAGGNNSMQSR